MSDATKVPAIPAVTPDNLPAVASAIKQLVDVREGRIGNPLDANVTFRDLIDAGMVSLRQGWNGKQSNSPFVIPPWSDSDGYDPTKDMTPPPAPSGVTATGLFASVQVQWDAPIYRNHSYAEVWRADTDVIGNAVLIGTSNTRYYVDSIGTSATKYYWVRFVSQADVEGPYQSLNGLMAQTATDPGLVLASLTGQITNTQLHSTLASRINLIDAPASTAGSVNARLAIVQGQVNDLLNIPAWSSTRNYAINEQAVYNGGLYKAIAASTNILPTDVNYWQKIGDYTSLGDAVAAHTTQISNLNTSLGQEITDRSALAVQLRGNYTGNDLSMVSQGLIYQERVARADAVSAVATSVTNLSAVVNTKTRVYYQNTAPAGTSGNPLRVDDIWVDTSIAYAQDYFASDYSIKSNRLYRWSGSQWVEAMDYGFADTFSAINLEQIARVNSDGALSQQISTLYANYESNRAAINQESLARATADSSLSSLVTSLTATVNSNKSATDAAVQSEATARANADSALSQTISTLSATVSSNLTTTQAAIQSEATARANADSSLTNSITTLQSTVTNNNTTLTAAIQAEAQTRADVDGGLLAQWTVKTDLNGYVSGFGLASTLKDATPSSTFAVRSDTFYIANPSGPGVAPAMPFIVRTTPTTIGGVSVPVGVYLTDAFIQNGTITNAKIANLAVDNAKIANLDAAKITTGYLSADRIDVGTLDAKIATLDAAVIKSGTLEKARIGDGTIDSAKIANEIKSTNFATGSAGWRIAKDGSAEFNNATFRGTVDLKSANSGARMEMKNNYIKVYDANGTLRVKIGDLSA